MDQTPSELLFVLRDLCIAFTLPCQQDKNLPTRYEHFSVTPCPVRPRMTGVPLPLPQGMLPNLPQYMIALLKVLLAAAPTSKTKSDSINILADTLPEEMP